MIKFLQNLFKKNYEDCDGSEFKSTYQNTPKSVLMDVRTAAEFKQGSLKGAVNTNMMSPTFSAEVRRLDPTKTYFVFCRSGARSGTAANMMSKLGLKVINLKGGIGAWPK